VRFLVDAQLPSQLARFLNARGHDAQHTSELTDGNRTTDARIAELADHEWSCTGAARTVLPPDHLPRPAPVQPKALDHDRSQVVSSGRVAYDVEFRLAHGGDGASYITSGSAPAKHWSLPDGARVRAEPRGAGPLPEARFLKTTCTTSAC